MELLAFAWLAAAFGVFMALIWSVYAVNRHAARRFGYEPFSLPNAALMLVVNLLLLSALAPAAAPGPSRTVMLGAATVLALGMLVVIARRVGAWLALYAVGLMAVGAMAVLPSLVFMRVAAASADGGKDARASAGRDRDEPPR